MVVTKTQSHEPACAPSQSFSVARPAGRVKKAALFL